MAKFLVKAELYVTLGEKPNTEEQQKVAILTLEQRINGIYWYDVDGNLCAPRIHIHGLGGIEESDG